MFVSLLSILSLGFYPFKCNGAPLALHSFPTRRSSDLHRPQVLLGHTGVAGEVTEGPLAGDQGALLFGKFGKAVHEFGVRSEEHTSELQSRGHLVCSLLLEKKK